MIFLRLLFSSIGVVSHVHLCTDTVNLCHTVRFPLLYPVYQALGFMIVIPSGFQIVIVDEKFERFNTTVFSIIFTGGSYNNTNIIFTTQVILPVEIIGSVSTGIRCRLQDIETFTVVATT